jgi:triosephosphate isomerase (TIM)
LAANSGGKVKEKSMRKLVAGNWKMHGLGGSLAELQTLKRGLGTPACDVLICPPATLIARAYGAAAGDFDIGGQDCSAKASGAFTGDISAAMLRDAGAVTVILGHSERRHYHGETDALVAEKVKAAWAAGLSVIICVGETEAQHEAGQAHTVCHSQVRESVPKTATAANTAIAYEPVWAIGTGKTPTLKEIENMHAHLRRCLKDAIGGGADGVRILYGGSVNPSNAAEILNLSEVDGALVGGASLKASDFLKIIEAIKPL